MVTSWIITHPIYPIHPLLGLPLGCLEGHLIDVNAIVVFWYLHGCLDDYC